jgi:hypothetical protein
LSISFGDYVGSADEPGTKGNAGDGRPVHGPPTKWKCVGSTRPVGGLNIMLGWAGLTGFMG